MKPAFTTDENTAVVDGRRYQAAMGVVPGSCKGCTFIEGFGCELWRLGGPSKCTSDQRQDRRGVIWVRPIT